MRSGWIFRSSITPLLDGRLLHGSRHTYGASVFGMCQQPKIGKSGAIKRTPRLPLSLASVTVPVVPFSTITSKTANYGANLCNMRRIPAGIRERCVSE